MNLTDEDRQWIGERLEQVNVRIEQVDARLEQVETRQLTEFHKWASPVEMRRRTHTAVLRAMDLELEGVADRVERLEGPQAQ